MVFKEKMMELFRFFWYNTRIPQRKEGSYGRAYFDR